MNPRPGPFELFIFYLFIEKTEDSFEVVGRIPSTEMAVHELHELAQVQGPVAVDVHLGSMSSTCLCAAFTHAGPKSTKNIQVISVLLPLWDLLVQKLHVKKLVKLTPGGN